MATASPTERRILGAPLVPPPRLTRLVNTVRRGLLGAHRRSAPPSMRVLEAVFGLFDNRILGLLVALGVPEALDPPQPATGPAATVRAEARALAPGLASA